MSKYVSLIFIVLLLSGCATHRLSKPLLPGEHEVHFSAGGPMIDMDGLVTPLPLTYLGYRYGLTDKITVGVDLPVTLMSLKNIALDTQVTYFPAPKIATQAELLLVWDVEHSVYHLYPLLSSWYAFDLGKDFYLMPGLSAMIQLQDPYLLASPFVALEKQFGKWSLSLELSYLTPYLKQTYTIDFISPGYGGIGLYLGIGRRF